MNYDNVIVGRDGAIAVVTLNRPQTLNALSYGLVKDLSLAMQELDQDPEVRVIVVTGGDKVFAAGADIKEMADKGPFDAMVQERLAYRDKINKISKPVIAAVIGFALGGGCELAMSCDIIVAAENARFGQPEVNLGIIPGSGGTQRLTQLVGKDRAMELVLTGDMLNASDAERLGLVNRVVPAELCLEEAQEHRQEDRRETAARGQSRQRGGAQIGQHRPRRRLGVRTQGILLTVRLGRPQRRHEGVSRKAQSGIQR